MPAVSRMQRRRPAPRSDSTGILRVGCVRSRTGSRTARQLTQPVEASPMRKTDSTLLLCLTLLLTVSCGGSSDSSSASGSSGTGSEASDDRPNGADTNAAYGDPLDESEESALIDAVRDRTAADGASYDFDVMEPVFTEAEQTIELTFRYLDESTIGGAPLAVISRQSGEIVSIQYTR